MHTLWHGADLVVSWSAEFGLLLAVPSGLVALFVRRFREPLGTYLLALAYVEGMSLWFACASIVHQPWGMVGFVIGCMTTPIGMVCGSLLVAYTRHTPGMFGGILVAVAFLLVCQFFGAWLVERYMAKPGFASEVEVSDAILDKQPTVHT
jgi:hypothetical protein